MILQDAQPCPISGLPVYSPSTWHYRTQDNHYQGNLSLVGTNIMVWQPWGIPQPSDAETITKLIFHAIDETFAASQEFSACFDYSNLQNPPIQNRLKVMTNLSQIMNRLNRVYFFGMEGSIKQILRLSLYLGGLSQKVSLCRDYRETIQTIIGQEKPTEQVESGDLESPEIKADLSRILSLMVKILWQGANAATVPELPSEHPLADLYSAVHVMGCDLSRRESTLQHRIEILERANREKEQRILTMTHEMRTPLSGISGALDLLEATKSPEEQKRLIETIRNSTEALASEISQVIDSVHIEDGAFTASPRPVNIHTFMQQLVSIFSPQCSQKNIDILLDLDPNLPQNPILNETSLRHIMINLLGNAVKFTDQGRITLGCYYIPETVTESPLLQFRVEDTGRGITLEHQQRIFERFFQGDSNAMEQQNRTESYRSNRGLGLGLSIVKVLTTSMGGSIDLISTPGRGSRFTISIPLGLTSQHITEIEHREPPITPYQEHQTMKAHILIIDDDETTRFILAGLCRTLGLTTKEAATPSGAIEILEQNSFDIILLDNYLQEMTGSQLLSQIRKLPNHTTTPAISVSGITREEGDQLVSSEGFTAFLQKPISRQSLEEVLSRTLSDNSQV